MSISMNPSSYHLRDSIIHPQPITPKPTARPCNNPSNHFHRHTKEAHPHAPKPNARKSELRTRPLISMRTCNRGPKNAITKAETRGKHTSALWLAQKTRCERRKEGRKEGREEGVSRSIMHMREPRWRLERRPVFRKRRVYR
jgi:hypothetical protein